MSKFGVMVMGPAGAGKVRFPLSLALPDFALLCLR